MFIMTFPHATEIPRDRIGHYVGSIIRLNIRIREKRIIFFKIYSGLYLKMSTYAKDERKDREISKSTLYNLTKCQSYLKCNQVGEYTEIWLRQ